MVKSLPASAGDVFIPGVGKIPGGVGNGKLHP